MAAFDSAGSPLSSWVLSVPPGGQISALTSDLFPSGNASGGMIGWVEMTSSSQGLQGFQVLGDFSGRVAGIAAADMSTDQVLPVSGGTAISLANPGLAPAAVTIKAYDSNGAQVGPALEKNVPAKGF